MKKILQYVKDSYNELVYKVSWPTRVELSNSAVVVLVASIIMAIILLGVDSAFQTLVDLFYGISDKTV